jgi:hypothetical protein
VLEDSLNGWGAMSMSLASAHCESSEANTYTAENGYFAKSLHLGLLVTHKAQREELLSLAPLGGHLA